MDARSTLAPQTRRSPPKIIDPCDLDHRVSKAIDRLLKRDVYLLQHNASERSITHRLACYLQKQFSKYRYDVDCEYNKDCDSGDNTKRSSEGRPVLPDITVHKRGTNSKNLLVIEVKKTTGGNDKRDHKRLCYFISKYKYEHALFLKFRTRGRKTGLKEYDWKCKCRHKLREDIETRS